MIALKSKITRRMLNYFFLNNSKSLYVNELARKLQLDKRNLVKKLKELETEGILKHQVKGNIKLYSVNKKYPLYGEYKNIILKTVGFEEQLKNILKGIEGIKEAFIYGSYAKDSMEINSDIDILIIGKHNIYNLQKYISRIQKELDREINVINIDEKEFKKQIKHEDSFITNILKKKHIRII